MKWGKLLSKQAVSNTRDLPGTLRPGFDPAAFAADANLAKVFRAPVALDVDKGGKQYVARRCTRVETG